MSSTSFIVCLVKKKLNAESVVDCLESIQFENEEEAFRIPEESQPLSNHPAISEQPNVIEVLRRLKKVNSYRYTRIVLTEVQRKLYVDDDRNLKFADQLLEGGSDRSLIKPRGSQNEEIVACTFKGIGCTFEGPQSASDHHLASAATSHISLMSAFVSRQKHEMQRLETRISTQQKEISDRKAESLKQQAEIERQKKQLSEQGTNISLLSEPLNSTMSTFIWKISGYARKLEASKSGARDVTYSDPFFTSKNGYKLQAILHLSDYVVGTHLPICIRHLPGEFDSILRWPFTMKASFTLIDQTENFQEASHITGSFEPDLSYRVSRRPTYYSSFACGFLKLVPHNILGTRNYVKDDTIFIKIEVG